MLYDFEELYNLFGDFDFTSSTPKYTVKKNDDESITLSSDLPGLTKETIEVRFESDNRLIVSGTRHGKSVGFSAYIQSKYNVSQSKAVYKDGVLRVTIPKTEKSSNVIVVE